ncbi:MAG: hypothetical protein KAH67_06140, partial [Flavobacteriaceae bacterium]|nr:hypothetical protein [Flavobacteriaceae bacterium]
MKKLFFLLFFISSLGFAQGNITYKSFNSTLLNSERTLKIYLPDSYGTEEENTYPVAVIFDAEYLFDIYTANAKLFAAREKAPEQIVIGVFQNQDDERYTDCDYSVDTGLPNEISSKFYGFVRDELLPYIEDNYRTSLFRTIVGNSLTANFTNYFFLESQPVFNAYININPSYAPGMNMKLETKSQSLNDEFYYYLSSGNFNNSKNKTAINEVHNLLKLSEYELFNYKF